MTTAPLTRRPDPVGALVRVAPLAAALVGLWLIVLGLDVLRDPLGADRVWASLYDVLGQSATADAIRERGLDAVQAKLTTLVVGVVVGVGGIWLVYVGLNAVADLLPRRLAGAVRPWLFVGPAAAMVAVFLVVPAIVTIWSSLSAEGGIAETYGALAEDPEMWVAVRNNVLWLVLGTGGSVGIGLLIATLVDRVKREALAKTFIFLPLAISMAGAAVIWRFVYAWVPESEPQIGILNAIWTALGNEPVAWLQAPPLNTFALIVIMVWLQTGFAMVVLSAALKGVPNEIIEAARIDGATERQLFFAVIVPMIKGTILAVATTIAIAILKVFDIVYVTTGGKFETEVLANRMFTELFTFRNFERASAIAVVLFLAVTPIIAINVRDLRRRRVGP
ncbi:MAG TPA: sugar ABC transporter permease [Candidatus Limnocylindrales bacterium]|nr:sugar ABC transporter permease [Candidatus Limnocylindrales bacterium]